MAFRCYMPGSPDAQGVYFYHEDFPEEISNVYLALEFLKNEMQAIITSAGINDDIISILSTWSSSKINESFVKVEQGKGLSTNDFTDVYKQKLDSLNYTNAEWYQLLANMHTHSNKSSLDLITSTKIQEWDNKSNFSGDYNDLVNKPTLPSNIASEEWVKTYHENNIPEDKVGDLNTLTTTAKDKLVNSVNEHDKEIGNLIDLLITPYKNYDLVGAINAIVLKIGEPKHYEISNSSDALIVVSNDKDPIDETKEIKLQDANINGGNFAVGDSVKLIYATGIYEYIDKMISESEIQPKKVMYYGRLSISEVGGSVIQYNQITADMIKNGANIIKTDLNVLNKTSLGLMSDTAEGDYTIVAVPKTEGYTATRDNGFGGKVNFSEEIAGCNGQYSLNIDGIIYDLYGEVLISPGEVFIYIDN